MNVFKELIKRKKFFTLFLSLFIFISGILIVILGLIISTSMNTINEPSNNESIIPISVIIFGAILIFIGFLIPKSIIKTISNEEKEKHEEFNEKKNIIQNLREIKLASDEEKQNYIIEKKLKTKISLPLSLTIGIIFL